MRENGGKDRDTAGEEGVRSLRNRADVTGGELMISPEIFFS